MKVLTFTFLHGMIDIVKASWSEVLHDVGICAIINVQVLSTFQIVEVN